MSRTSLAGVFDRFWFWVFSYARTYSGQVSFTDGLQILRSALVSHLAQAPIAWALAGLGLIFLATDRPKWIACYCLQAHRSLIGCLSIFDHKHRDFFSPPHTPG
jgi:hypothetical protein